MPPTTGNSVAPHYAKSCVILHKANPPTWGVYLCQTEKTAHTARRLEQGRHGLGRRPQPASHTSHRPGAPARTSRGQRASHKAGHAALLGSAKGQRRAGAKLPASGREHGHSASSADHLHSTAGQLIRQATSRPVHGGRATSTSGSSSGGVVNACGATRDHRAARLHDSDSDTGGPVGGTVAGADHSDRNGKGKGANHVKQCSTTLHKRQAKKGTRRPPAQRKPTAATEKQAQPHPATSEAEEGRRAAPSLTSAERKGRGQPTKKKRTF